MLGVVGVDSLDDLIDKTIPQAIRQDDDFDIGDALSETEALQKLSEIMGKNKIFKSFIGAGYYECITPSVILRNMLENPGWYTPYTPYQAEIAQGRLEMLLNFQTMVGDLCGLPVANASLLDEATAAGEAATMAFSIANKKKPVFIAASNCHPHTIDVVKTRLENIQAEVKVVAPQEFDFSKKDVCGVLIQYPDTFGNIEDYSSIVKQAHDSGAIVIAASDLLALTTLTPPGEWGVDVVVGSAQRFGVPLGFGGPHAGFLATKDEHKRKIPGRLIGVSRDVHGNRALRMAMQTREQHIRRDRATSNICTAQALLANISAAYGIYHGPSGLKNIATRVHGLAKVVCAGVKHYGFTVRQSHFFDTLQIDLGAKSSSAFAQECEKREINVRILGTNSIGVSVDEATNQGHLQALIDSFAALSQKHSVPVSQFESAASSNVIPASLTRSSPFMTHPVFNSHESETEMMRYLFCLQSKDLSLQSSMIPLGSCTMKLNAASEMIPVTWPSVGKIHPFAPLNQTKGYMEMIETLGRDLANVTGFHSISFQPNSGSQGEYAGLLCIKAYHQARGESQRDVCLIPTSAHGTNPASAVLAGMKVVVVNCDSNGSIDIEHLRAKAEEHKDKLACAMITYPSTHGVFEENIREMCDVVHQQGGLVYMDGANFTAQVGFCSPGGIGADVCHLNLHKTFCIPHGGGGPGMGPIGVTKELAPFLPGHVVVHCGGEKAIRAVSAAPYSSASILPISWMYMKMMGTEGIRDATKFAILNANYMVKRLEKDYQILYRGKNGFVAHEFIIDFRPFKEFGISEEDVAKRLMDFNFHGPTMSWPVVGTLMVEPTESEPLNELDRMCDALLHIRKEIAQVESGVVAPEDSVLKGAPHTAEAVLSDSWNKKYSRETAAFPLPYLRKNKFWPTVGRIDNVFGDRNIVCSCPPISEYQ